MITKHLSLVTPAYASEDLISQPPHSSSKLIPTADILIGSELEKLAVNHPIQVFTYFERVDRKKNKILDSYFKAPHSGPITKQELALNCHVKQHLAELLDTHPKKVCISLIVKINEEKKLYHSFLLTEEQLKTYNFIEVK